MAERESGVVNGQVETRTASVPIAGRGERRNANEE
jgi:hypothetical protein